MEENISTVPSFYPNLSFTVYHSEYGPEFSLSDYIEVTYNLAAIVFGVPVNFWALHSHLKVLHGRPTHARLIWLGVNLTLANLMILLIHSAGTASWLLTYFWYTGDFLCRVFKFLSIMSFHISSNVVVSIALDMFHSLHAPLRSQIRDDARRRVRILLIASWLVAVFLSLPQLYLWGEIDDPIFDPNRKVCAFLFLTYAKFALMYNLAHLLSVFYIPLIFILFCYVGSAYHVWKHLRLQSNLIQHPSSTSQYSIDIRNRSNSNNCAMDNRKRSISSPSLQQKLENGKLSIGGSPQMDQRKRSTLSSSQPIDRSSITKYRLDPRKQSTTSSLMISLLDNRYQHGSIFSNQQRRPTTTMDRQTRTKMRLLRKSAAVIGGYIVCWLPYQIFNVWQSFCDEECQMKHYEIINTKLRWLEALMISCACLNPFLYTFVRRRSNQQQTNSSSSPRRISHDVGTFYSTNRADTTTTLTYLSKRDSILACTRKDLRN